MDRTNAKDLVDAYSSALVLLEPGDVEELARIGDLLGRIASAGEGRARSKIHGIAQKGIETIDRVLAGDTSARECVLQVLSLCATGLQDLVLAGHEPREVAFRFQASVRAIESGSRRRRRVDFSPAEKPAPTEATRSVEESTSAEESLSADGDSGDSTDRMTPLVLAGQSEEGPELGNLDLGLCNEFLSEASEHLDRADSALGSLRSDLRSESAIQEIFRTFHTIKGAAAYLGLPDISELAHEVENLLDAIRRGEVTCEVPTVDLVQSVADRMSRLLERFADALETGNRLERDPTLPELMSRIQATSRTFASALESSSQGLERPDDSIAGASPDAGAPKETSATADEAPAADQDERGQGPSRAASFLDAPKRKRVTEYVRVDSRRLDGLVESIGELVTAVSVLGQALPENLGEAGSAAVKHVETIGRELQEFSTSLRMVPLRSTFRKMERLVRDLAVECGKPVRVSTTGQDTEIDKAMVDRLADPLLHLIRNAVDHGIEDSTKERRRAGKSATGQIELRAYHHGGRIYIEVEDDGRGIDRERLKQASIAKGLLNANQSISDQELLHTVFSPGLSTARELTSVSGRGVGMDIVRQRIEAMRGTIEIQSEPGLGTLFTLRLPLTIAIIDGMVVRVGQERFILPTLSILRSIHPSEGQLNSVLDRGEVVEVHGRMVPLFRLGDLLEISDAVDDPSEGSIVILENDGAGVGFLVDELIGQQQIVIKSLGRSMERVPGISGGAVMADGRIGLIVDIEGLLRLSQSREHALRS